MGPLFPYRARLTIEQFSLVTLASLAVLAAGCSSSAGEPTGAGGSVGPGAAGASGGNGTPTTGTAGTGGSVSGGSLGTGGPGATGSGAAGAGGSSGSGGAGQSSSLPWLTVNGNKLQDPTGKTIVLRGSALIDIGALYAYGGMSPAGVMTRMDKIAAAGVQGHVVRLPVYPKIDYNPVAAAPRAPPPLPGRHGPHRFLHAEIAALRRRLRRQGAETGGRLCDQQEPVRHHRLPPDRQRHHRDLGGRREDVLDGHRAQVRRRQQRPLRTVQRTDRQQCLLVSAEAGGAAAHRHHPRRRPQEPHHRAVEHLGPAPRRRGQRPAQRHQPDVHGPHLRVELEAPFQAQVATATAKAPVFISEWGYGSSDPESFGTSLQTTANAVGASWTAWVTDNGWTPSMFADASLTTLTNFGMLVKSWLAATASSDWVQ